MAARQGFPLILCAPSGAGKSTLVKKLCAEFPLAFSISCTTRAPREGEIDGVHYHFLTKEAFEQKIQNNEFAEWAVVHGNYYGTPLKPVTEQLAQGKDILFDIDIQGAKQLSLSLPGAKFVFIFPPSLEILKERLVNRGTDSMEVIERRLKNAIGEIEQSHWFDAWIVNDDLDKAYDELRAFYLSCTLEPRLCTQILKSVLGK